MREKEMMQAVYDVYHVPSVLLNENQTIVHKIGYHHEHFPFEWLKNQTLTMPACIVIHPDKVAAAMIRMNEQYQLYLGNVFLGEKSDRKIWLILQQYNLTDNQSLAYLESLPVFSLSSMKQLIQMLAHCLTGKLIEPVILTDDNPSIKVMVNDLEDDCRQMDYTSMMTMMRLVAYGRTEEVVQHIKYENYKTIFSDISEIKQGAIQLSVLIAIAALKGGLGFQETNTLISGYLNQLALLNSGEAIHHLQNEMLLVVTEAVRQTNHPVLNQPLNQRIKQYVSLHLTENISFSKMAEALHVSKNYMLSEFKKEAGISLVDYVMKRKVSEAAFLLDEGTLSIAAISAHLGFSSQSYFAQCFKKVTGMTPSAFLSRKDKII